MSRRFHLSLIVALTLSCAASRLFAEDKASPAAARELDRVSHLQLPLPDREVLRIEDEQEALEGIAPRFAVPNPVSITPETGGTWDAPGPETRVWRQRISSPGAVSINLGFTRFHLPPGAQLVMRSSDGRSSIRSFNDGDNNPNNQLWTPPLAGDDLLVELTVPTVMLGRYDLEIGSINIGYRRFGSIFDPNEVTPRSGSCNVDVACSTADPWRLQVKAVAVISTGGSRFCTGFMVNNTTNDRRPYFMTANHCGITSGNAASLVAFWNYENSTCRGIPGGGGVGDGTLTQFTTGSTFRAAFATSDFTLVEFTSSPNPIYQVSFAGWDRTGANPPSGACIHHPSTDEKRITLYDIAARPDRPTHGSSWPCSAFPGPGDNTHIAAYWSLGVTEPGSSGSPLFDDNKRIIGQLHGGPSACGQSGDNLSDCYGRFSRSWTGGGASSSRLSDWLDPGNTGANAIDGIPSAGLVVTPSGNVTSVGLVGGPFTNSSTTYTINNPGANPVDYSVSLVAGGTAPLLLDGGAGPVSGTLPGSGSVNVIVSIDAAANSLPAGIYSTTVRFTDVTGGNNTDRVHTIEIGQTNFTTAPGTGLSSGGPVGGPFNATQVYTLTSTQPSPVNITVSANQTWISINGGAGPVNLTLNGTGDTQNVTIGYSAAANALPAGIYSGTVTFTNVSGGGGGTTRPVSLDVGRYTYTYPGPAIPINDLQTITSTINVTDSYCIVDVDVSVNITHTYISDLIVEVISPTGVTVRLHNRTGGSADDIVRTYNDGVVNPDGPGMLADFIGTPVNGTWTLRVSDNASADVGTLNSWSLSIASGTGTCPTPTVIYSFPFDTNPGWTTQGQWAFGAPQGLCGDPATARTGANVYGYNLAGCYPNNLTPVQYLTTTAIDCSSITNVKLRFWRRLGVESATYDHANIQVSNNGTTWTDVWNHSGVTLNESAWTQQSHNISSVADGRPTVYIRWGMGTTDSSAVYQGWNIDDVEIIGVSVCATVFNGDTSGDAKYDGADIAGFIKAYVTPALASSQEFCASDMDDDGDVDDLDLDRFVNGLL